MYLFTRTARLAPGQIRESMAWAIDITERVNRAGEVDVALWSRVFSAGLGTLTWSAFVPDLLALETLEAKLMADDGYLTAVDRGAAFNAGGIDDALSTIVHGELDPTARPEYVSVVEATLAPGAFREGVVVGIEIAERATTLVGAPVLFAMRTTNTYGGVAWLTGHADVESLQRGEQALNADAAFVELIDTRASTVYQLAAEQFVLRRVV